MNMLTRSDLVTVKVREPGKVCHDLVEVDALGVSMWSFDLRAQAQFLWMKGRVCIAGSPQGLLQFELRGPGRQRLSHTWLGCL